MNKQLKYDSLVVLGPTASGKTKLAVEIAAKLNGEILSADSRMVYKKMDIGTGKDLNEYFYRGEPIKYHLINLVEPNEHYHINRFQNDFKKAFGEVISKGKLPIICGGSGLYLEAVIYDYIYTSVPVNTNLKSELINLSHQNLIKLFETYPTHPFKENVDLSTQKRTIRAIEIIDFLNKNPSFKLPVSNPINPLIIGLNPTLNTRRANISYRLKMRIDNGLIEEVEGLINEGLTFERLAYFGLEYKWVSRFIKGEINKIQLFEKLDIAIQQFAKRQMTYFRKMEKGKLEINWINHVNEVWNLLPDNLGTAKT